MDTVATSNARARARHAQCSGGRSAVRAGGERNRCVAALDIADASRAFVAFLKTAPAAAILQRSGLDPR
ncbi:hypothetical protein [Burkholderia sp. Bp9143]|uniref:hypothetical protein n=1 Tax=Burkholderia sp. Bp9143 TaxID=2184574 RepID=UPI0021AB289B|nr:hypothetical protein [Burkholderia sp. Bp9143]